MRARAETRDGKRLHVAANTGRSRRTFNNTGRRSDPHANALKHDGGEKRAPCAGRKSNPNIMVGNPPRIGGQRMRPAVRTVRGTGAHSLRIEPINRSAYAFCHGERAAVGRSRMSIARTRPMNYFAVGPISVMDEVWRPRPREPGVHPFAPPTSFGCNNRRSRLRARPPCGVRGVERQQRRARSPGRGDRRHLQRDIAGIRLTGCAWCRSTAKTTWTPVRSTRSRSSR
jgi:hypothetical protein